MCAIPPLHLKSVAYNPSIVYEISHHHLELHDRWSKPLLGESPSRPVPGSRSPRTKPTPSPSVRNIIGSVTTLTAPDDRAFFNSFWVAIGFTMAANYTLMKPALVKT